jgi:indole-3-glycerol phosphate synthase
VSAGAALPDVLRRIVEQRRERLRDHRARHPEASLLDPQDAGATLTTARNPPLRSDDAGAGLLTAAQDFLLDPDDAGADPLTAAQNPFLAALRRAAEAPAAAGTPRAPAIIAEVKMGSPRLGSLHGRFDPLAQARTYAANGAAALSVVVEPDFFFGSYELLAACRAASGLPAIAKDFVVDPLQLLWARQAGADAVLLIAALYEPEELVRYARLARVLGLAPLVETHDAADLALLAGEPWELVGINNRDLRSFDVDLERSIALLPALPREALKVAESGIRDALDVALLADSGFDALLVGESLLLAADPAAALRALLGEPSPAVAPAEHR